jgi:dienelactone hydrolase
MQIRFPFVCLTLILPLSALAADDSAPAPLQFNPYVKRQAADMRSEDKPPASMDEWEHRRALLKTRLLAAWGGFPEKPCDLEPKMLGEIDRPDYRIEKLVIQTRPGVWMTANAYVPKKEGRLPAILNVHGHWAGAKQDPVVQSRCIAAARSGYFVLAVDAFGAGERGLGKKLGEYHGEMVAATLFPVGLPLSGLQVYENMRAVDYLSTRSEVDPERIGITGASGGGNQTMYAGAFDERFRCVVPTCSVGNYQAYLSAACCMCEVVPGALSFTEEGDVLGLAAHRGLMVTSATRDAYQFSVDEAKKSLERANAIAALYKNAEVKHTIIESEHAYNKPMREAMLGWMARHLKGEGDGSPITEPDIVTEEPESLRCFPGESRPDDFVTIPRFAAAEARRMLARHTVPESAADFHAWRQRSQTALEAVFGDTPAATPLNVKAEKNDAGNVETLTFNPEPGLTLTLTRNVVPNVARIAVLLDLETESDKTFAGNLSTQLAAAGWMVVAPDLRATGRCAVQRDTIGRAPDHNSAEWSLWIGRPLLGQWTVDVRRALDAIREKDGSLPKEVTVVGNRSAALVALCSAVQDERIARVVTMNSLSSYVTEQPYAGQRLGLMAPAIVRDVGDVAQIASLIAPRPVIIAGGVTGAGKPVGMAALREEFKFTTQVYSLMTPEGETRLQVVSPDDVVGLLRP